MPLTREEDLGIIRNKLVRLGILTDPDTAHNLALLESRLVRALVEHNEKINPYAQVGKILRCHRERRQLPRHEVVRRANQILHAIGDQGFCAQSAVCHIEAGSQRLQFLQAAALANVYGIPYDTLLPPGYDPELGLRDGDE